MEKGSCLLDWEGRVVVAELFKSRKNALVNGPLWAVLKSGAQTEKDRAKPRLSKIA